MVQQVIVFMTIILTLIFFIKGDYPYDLVALSALLFLILTGILPGEKGFNGFGHPAVITVAAVMIISRGLLYSGLVDLLARKILTIADNLVLQLIVLVSCVTFFSGFINNIGALSLFLPVSLKLAHSSGRSPSLYLMPLSFGSLLGGMITMMGTPPNIIIAMFRSQEVGVPFGMFDFSLVGLFVAFSGVFFIGLVGWRLLPLRSSEGIHDEPFKINEYISEVSILPKSPFVGKTLRELSSFGEQNVVVLDLIRDGHHFPSPSSLETLKEDDILIVEAEAKALRGFIEENALKLVGSRRITTGDQGMVDFQLLEIVVMPHSSMLNRTVKGLNLRWQHGINLLAVARKGVRLQERLVNISFKAGDVLLIQGNETALQNLFSNLGCLPLAERELWLGRKTRIFPAGMIFLATITMMVLGIVPVQVALVFSALVMVLMGLVPLRRIYDSIEWPLIILLGSMISVGQALEMSGGAATISSLFLSLGSYLPPAMTLLLLMLATMILANVINTAAAAVLMAPIAASLARGLGVSMDPLLMGIAISASSSFMTPIGHQSNILVMGPGGYQFEDYWKLGLPLSLLVLFVSIPLILWFWPL